jgi:hypothetical protein
MRGCPEFCEGIVTALRYLNCVDILLPGLLVSNHLRSTHVRLVCCVDCEIPTFSELLSIVSHSPSCTVVPESWTSLRQRLRFAGHRELTPTLVDRPSVLHILAIS